MTVRLAEHGIAGSRLCGRGGEGGWQRAGSYAPPPGDRALVVPTVEAIATVGWCCLARRAHRGGVVMGEHAAAVWAQRRWRERRAGAMAKPIVEQMRDFFILW